MAKLSRFYYDRSGEVMKTPREWREYMKENGLNVMRLYKADIVYRTHHNVCKLINQQVRTGSKEQCNPKCPHHTDIGNGRCSYFGYIYTPSNKVIMLEQRGVQIHKDVKIGKREQNAINESCRAFGVTEEQLYARCRKTALVHTRHFLLVYFVSHLNHPIKASAMQFKLLGSNYYYAMRQLTGEYETSRVYRTKINDLLKTLGINPGRYILKLTKMRDKLQKAKCYK